MSILSQLATAFGNKNEVPNIELAIRLVAKPDPKAIDELVQCLSTATMDIRSDAIKVLYEIGERKPELIADHVSDFISLLDTKNNRILWGLITALNTITLLKPKEIYAELPAILSASERGSVIAKDRTVGILSNLATTKTYSKKVLPLLLDEIKRAPENQLAMYAEMAAPVVDASSKQEFVSILTTRLKTIDKESKKKRIEKVLKKLPV